MLLLLRFIIPFAFSTIPLMIAPFTVEIITFPLSVLVILPIVVSLSVFSVVKIFIFPFLFSIFESDKRFIVPFWFAIVTFPSVFFIEEFIDEVALFVEIPATDKPFEVIATSPIFVVIELEMPVVPLFVSIILPFPLVIVPDIAAKPELFEILISPVSFEIAFDIVKPFREEITTNSIRFG